MSDTPIPSPEQLQAARSERWHHTGEGLFTVEALRPWLHRFGLVLFSPRPQQLAIPAPTLVEAVAGASNPAPTLPERQTARDLVYRLVVEGTAIPLNLLGAPGTTSDEPDFVAAASALPYLFTLRGDKGWKQLPSTDGPFKVSPLAVNTYTMLSESGPRSAADLATELGKGLTEAAVLRALNELWQHLRVLPVREQGGQTLWEPLTTRFSKAVKAGANAGQPSAISALISLYLEQAMVATETETETFLSPLAARSRVRDVLHALRAAQELEEIVIAGKHCLHLPDGLPQFAPPAEPASDEAQPEAAEGVTTEGEGRIKRFVAPPKKVGTGFKPRPKPFGGERERRPFQREGAPRPGARPERKSGSGFATKRGPADFSKPWEEERQSRQARESRDSQAAAAAGAERKPFRNDAEGGLRPKRPYTGKPSFGSRSATAGGSRPAFSRGPRGPMEAGGKPSFDRERRPAGPGGPADRDGAQRRPQFGSDRAPRDRGVRPERPPFRERPPSDPDRAWSPKREEGRPAKPAFFRDSASRGLDRSRGPQQPGGAKRPYDKRESGAFPNRPDSPSGEGRPPFRRFDAPAGDRFQKDRPERPPRPRGEFAAGAERPRGPRPGPPRPAGPRPGGPRSGAPDREGARPPRPFSGRPSGGASARPGAGGFASKRTGDRPFAERSGPKKPYAKRPPSGAPSRAGETGRPAGPFDKFKDGNKPWGKRPPKRKIKREDEA